MRWSALVVLCACNQVFGLRQTQQLPPTGAADAQYFDAPIDAPFACPPIGTAPRFSPLLHQIIAQPCNDYTIATAAGIATADCGSVLVGPVDQPLAAAPGLAAPPNFSWSNPRITPEGDEVYIFAFNEVSSSFSTQVARRAADGSWSQAPDLPVPPGIFPGTPSRRPFRHVAYAAAGKLHEIVDDGTNTWPEVAAYTFAELGTGYLNRTQLSSDGLRMLLIDATTTADLSTFRTLYVDRPSIDARFGLAVPLDGVPVAFDVFMTEDCSRIYMSALQQIIYVQQK